MSVNRHILLLCSKTNLRSCLSYMDIFMVSRGINLITTLTRLSLVSDESTILSTKPHLTVDDRGSKPSKTVSVSFFITAVRQQLPHATK